MLFMSSLGVGYRSGTHGVGVVRSRGSEEGSVGSLGVWPSGGGVERSNLFVSKLQTPKQLILSRAERGGYSYSYSKRNFLAQT